MPPFLALIPVKDWIYAGLIVALLAGFGWYTIHERHIGAAHEVAVLKASSEKLNKDADAKIAKLTADHNAQSVAIIGVIYNERKASAIASASDAQRVREFDAYRRAHPAVGSPASVPGNPNDGNGSAISVDDILGRLEVVAQQLTAANRLAKTALNSCMIERDSLTGK